MMSIIFIARILMLHRRSITVDRYRAWLQLLVDGNQNMVRVWAGGIYEPDAFYDICDGKSFIIDCWCISNTN